MREWNGIKHIHKGNDFFKYKYKYKIIYINICKYVLFYDPETILP